MRIFKTTTIGYLTRKTCILTMNIFILRSVLSRWSVPARCLGNASMLTFGKLNKTGKVS